MKALHVSDAPLPDARIEKMAYLSKKRGWKTFFVGPGFNDFALHEKVFDCLYYVPWKPRVRLGFQPFFRQFKKKLRK